MFSASPKYKRYETWTVLVSSRFASTRLVLFLHARSWGLATSKQVHRSPRARYSLTSFGLPYLVLLLPLTRLRQLQPEVRREVALFSDSAATSISTDFLRRIGRNDAACRTAWLTIPRSASASGRKGVVSPPARLTRLDPYQSFRTFEESFARLTPAVYRARCICRPAAEPLKHASRPLLRSPLPSP